MWKQGVVIFTSMFVLSCSSTGDDPPGGKAVGVEGGTITMEQVSVEVPQGALDKEVTISVTTSTVPAPSGYSAYSAVYSFEPEGVVFAKPVKVTLPFSGDPARAAIFWKGSADSQFQWLGGVSAGDKISVEVSHFSSGVVLDGSCPYILRASGTGEAPKDMENLPTCSRESTCHGKTFLVSCSNRDCVCKIDDVVTHSFSDGTCVPEPCGFPARKEPVAGDGGSTVTGDGSTTTACMYSAGTSASSEGEVCTTEATCGGHDYFMTCASTSGSCECKVDGQVTQTITGSWCDPQDCGFPTDGPSPDSAVGPTPDSGVVPDMLDMCNWAVKAWSPGPDQPTFCEANVECQGHSYQINCDDGSYICSCTMDGSVVQTVPGSTCSPADCGFPGS